MSRLVSYVRSLRATPLGRYIPGNKVLAGLLAGSASAALTKAGVIAVPPLYVSLAAFAAVSYLLPESPVAAAHVIARKGGVTVRRVTKSSLDVHVADTFEAIGLGIDYARSQVPHPASQAEVADLEQPGPIDASVQPPVVPPQSA